MHFPKSLNMLDLLLQFDVLKLTILILLMHRFLDNTLFEYLIFLIPLTEDLLSLDD